jgi:hypothetical protein
LPIKYCSQTLERLVHSRPERIDTHGTDGDFDSCLVFVISPSREVIHRENRLEVRQKIFCGQAVHKFLAYDGGSPETTTNKDLKRDPALMFNQL